MTAPRCQRVNGVLPSRSLPVRKTGPGDPLIAGADLCLGDGRNSFPPDVNVASLPGRLGGRGGAANRRFRVSPVLRGLLNFFSGHAHNLARKLNRFDLHNPEFLFAAGQPVGADASISDPFDHPFGDLPYLDRFLLARLHPSKMEKTHDTYLGKRGRPLHELRERTLHVLPGREM